MSSRLIVLACVALALATGCRDLVTPEGAMNNGSPAYEVIVQGLGSEGLLRDAQVDVDNSAYVPEGEALTASAITESGVAIFEDVPPGFYDVSVYPDWTSSTPPWAETRVELGDSIAVLAYDGIPVQFELDWPELAEFAPENLGKRIVLRYRLATNGLSGTGYQTAQEDEDGILRGFIPWAGNFAVVAFVNGAGFGLEHSYPDSVPLAADASFRIPSPLRIHALDLRIGDAPFSGDQLTIRQQDADDGVHLNHAWLFYTIDRLRHPDTVFLLDSPLSRLEFNAVGSPLFMDQYVWLADGPVVPPAIQLGRWRVTFRVEDEFQQPLPALIQVANESREQSWSTELDGTIDLWLMPGLHRLLVRAEGYEDSILLLPVDRNLDHTITLAREAE